MILFILSVKTHSTIRQDNELHGRRCKHLCVHILIHQLHLWPASDSGKLSLQSNNISWCRQNLRKRAFRW